MLTDQLRLHTRVVDASGLPEKANTESNEILTWGTGDTIRDASRLLNSVISDAAETTACSPVIPTDELTRIRNNVVSQFNTLRNNYSNVGASLDSRGLSAQYLAVFDAMVYDSFCHYQNDAHLVRDIQNCGNGANQILNNAFNQYANNFAAKMPQLRSSFSQLQNAASSASNTVEPTINAYKAVINSNFSFNLHQGINGNLDNLLNEYSRIYNSCDAIFDQGTQRVQGNFEARVRQLNTINSQFGRAYTHWDTIDGDIGYGMFVDNIRAYDDELSIIGRFVVLDTQLNRQIFGEIDIQIDRIQKQYSSFPNFVTARPSAGFALDPSTSARKFFSRQLTLNIAQGAGAHYSTQISPGSSLIGTGFSYQHGGKMPPHSEHKDGRDCDIFSAHFKVGAPEYDEAKSIAMATWLLQAGVSRLIYTNTAVVNAANTAVPGNPVAVANGGHETHMHFDVEQAT